MSQPIITVVGSSNTDLVVRVPHIPLPGETLIGEPIQHIPGGKGANQAVAARRLEAEVWFVGCLGDDGFGDSAADTLAQEGVRLDYLTRVNGIPSGVALIAVAANGENSIVVVPGANAHLTVTAVERAHVAISSSAIVIAQLEVPIAAMSHAFSVARAAGKRTLLNPAPAQALADEVMTLVDVLVCNETEAATLTGVAVTDLASCEQEARQLRDRGPSLVIVTLGNNGCLVCAEHEMRHIAAYTVEVVDTTAAGDCFVGALAVRLALGDDAFAAARYASAAAAISVTRAGAQPSLPHASEVEVFLNRMG
ncbi:MAG TPA: ribokinase [Ktedonobacterales bacterium]|nr:ribokinase [Ktedonobacterales bacterium]